MSALLEVHDLKVHYDGMERPVINGVSLRLEKGKVLGVVGESGCGKTTLAHTIIGALPAAGSIEHGDIYFAGQNLRDLSVKERRTMQGNDLGMIVQASLSSLNPVRRIGAQFVQLLAEKRGLSKQAALKRATYYLNQMSCSADTLKKYPFQLSGGQRQRVIITMAFALQPKLLIADEPTTALDVTVQAQVLQEMMTLQADLDTGILLISHNLGVVAQLCDDIAVMYQGEIVEYGSTETILTKPIHPYTKGLIQSIPDLNYPKTKPLYEGNVAHQVLKQTAQSACLKRQEERSVCYESL